MSTLRTLLTSALFLAPTPALAATGSSADWMYDAITWLAETYGPNIPTQVQVDLSPEALLDGGDVDIDVHLFAVDTSDDAADAWAEALESEFGGLDPLDELALSTDDDDSGDLQAIELDNGGFDMTDEPPLLSAEDLFADVGLADDFIDEETGAAIQEAISVAMGTTTYGYLLRSEESVDDGFLAVIGTEQGVAFLAVSVH